MNASYATQRGVTNVTPVHIPSRRTRAAGDRLSYGSPGRLFQTLSQLNHLVRNRTNQSFIVACQHEAKIPLINELAQKLCYFALHQRIKPRCRLVGDQTIRFEQ